MFIAYASKTYAKPGRSNLRDSLLVHFPLRKQFFGIFSRKFFFFRAAEYFPSSPKWASSNGVVGARHSGVGSRTQPTPLSWSNLRDLFYYSDMDSGFLLLCTILHYPGACL